MRIPKKLVGLLAIVSVLLLPACAVGAVQAAPAEVESAAPAQTVYNGGEEKATERSITVQGQGTVSAKPDIATLSLGVQTIGATAQEALALNSEQMTAVIAALLEAGIAEDDIQTAGLNLYPVYDNQRVEPGGTREVIGYRATNNVSITVHDIAMGGTVLDTAVRAGANVASGIQFGLSDMDAIIDDALVASVRDAQAKAQTIADALGVKVGQPLVVTQEYIERPRGNVYLERAEAAFDSGGFAPPVQGGTVSVTAHIRVTFAIE